VVAYELKRGLDRWREQSTRERPPTGVFEFVAKRHSGTGSADAPNVAIALPEPTAPEDESDHAGGESQTSGSVPRRMPADHRQHRPSQGNK
jgi:hypothetical protein